MIKSEFTEVPKLSVRKRYDYFIRKVADYEEVWGLYDDGWATSIDEKENKLIPFWPKKEFAAACAIDEWKSYTPEAIDLYEFMDEWMINMKEGGYKPSIFLCNEDSALVEIDTLLEDLNTELENY